MNTAIWTLWLLTYGPGVTTPPVTALAAYTTQADCIKAISMVNGILKDTAPAGQTNIGTFFCVPGEQVKR